MHQREQLSLLINFNNFSTNTQATTATTTTTLATTTSCPNYSNQADQLYVNLSTFWYCFLALTTTIGLLVSLISNAIIIYLFTRCLRKNPSNIIAVNLSLSDLLYCTQWPSVIYCSITQSTWILEHKFVCQTFGFISVSTAFASILTILAMSIERALVITYSMNAKKRFTTRAAWLIIVIIWLISLVSCIPPLFGKVNRYTLDPSKTSCTLDYVSNRNSYKLYMLILYFVYWFAPTLIILISYTLIMVTFKKSSSNLKEVSASGGCRGGGGGEHQTAKSSMSLSIERGSSLLDGSIRKQSGDDNSSRHKTVLDGFSAPYQAGRKTSQQDGIVIIDKQLGNSPLKTRRLSMSVIDLDRIQPEHSSKLRHNHHQQQQLRLQHQLLRQIIEKEFSEETIDGFRMRVLERVASTSMLLRASNQRVEAPFRKSQKWQTNNNNDFGNNDVKSNDNTTNIKNTNSKLSSTTTTTTTTAIAATTTTDCFAMVQDSTTTTTATTSGGIRKNFSQILRGSLRDAYQRRNQQRLLKAPRRKTFEELHSNFYDNRLIMSVSRLGSKGRLLIGKHATNLSTNQAANSQVMRTMLQFRLARMSFYLILLWLVSWTPMAFLVVINSAFACHQASATGVFMANTMTKLGPALDVFIYGVSHPKIKSKFKKIIKRLFTFNNCIGRFNE